MQYNVYDEATKTLQLRKLEESDYYEQQVRDQAYADAFMKAYRENPAQFPEITNANLFEPVAQYPMMPETPNSSVSFQPYEDVLQEYKMNKYGGSGTNPNMMNSMMSQQQGYQNGYGFQFSQPAFRQGVMNSYGDNKVGYIPKEQRDMMPSIEDRLGYNLDIPYGNYEDQNLEEAEIGYVPNNDPSTKYDDEFGSDEEYDSYITDRMNPEYNAQVYDPNTEVYAEDMIYEQIVNGETVYVPEVYDYSTDTNIGGYEIENVPMQPNPINQSRVPHFLMSYHSMRQEQGVTPNYFDPFQTQQRQFKNVGYQPTYKTFIDNNSTYSGVDYNNTYYGKQKTVKEMYSNPVEYVNNVPGNITQTGPEKMSFPEATIPTVQETSFGQMAFPSTYEDKTDMADTGMRFPTKLDPYKQDEINKQDNFVFVERNVQPVDNQYMINRITGIGPTYGVVGQQYQQNFNTKPNNYVLNLYAEEIVKYPVTEPEQKPTTLDPTKVYTMKELRDFYSGVYDNIQEDKKLYGDDVTQHERLKRERYPYYQLTDEERQHNLRVREELNKYYQEVDPYANLTPYNYNMQQQQPYTTDEYLPTPNRNLTQNEIDYITNHNNSAVFINTMKLKREYFANGIQKDHNEILQEVHNLLDDKLKKRLNINNPNSYMNMTKDERLEAELRQNMHKLNYSLRNSIPSALMITDAEVELYRSKAKQKEILDTCSNTTEMMIKLGRYYEKEYLWKPWTGRKKGSLIKNEDRVKLMRGMQEHFDPYYEGLRQAYKLGQIKNNDDIMITRPAPTQEYYDKLMAFVTCTTNKLKEPLPKEVVAKYAHIKRLVNKYNGEGRISIEEFCDVPESEDYKYTGDDFKFQDVIDGNIELNEDFDLIKDDIKGLYIKEEKVQKPVVATRQIQFIGELEEE